MANIDVQPITLTGWQDRRTVGIELWIFSSQDWVDINGVPHGAGNIEDRVWTQRVSGLTVNTTNQTLTIPTFALVPTRNALRGPTVTLTFWIVAVAGTSVTRIKQVPGTQNGLTIPSLIVSTSGCSPIGTCATWAELIQYNTPTPALPVATYMTRDEVNALVAGLTSGGGFAPSNATYLLKTSAGAGLPNAQVMGVLATGLIKNTTTTGVQSIAVAGTDYLDNSSSLNATNLGSGTVPDARFPATLPAVSGVNLTNLNASNLASGTIPNGRFPATLPAASGVNLTALNATELTSGLIPVARGQEVWAVTDLTTYASVSGTGTAAIRATITAPVLNQVLSWDGSNWINAAPVAGFADPMTTRGDLIFRNASNVTARLPIGAASRYLSSDGTDASWAQVSLTAGVTGLLPPANGGIGLALGSANRVVSVNSAANAHEYRDILFGATGTTPNAAYAANSITLHFPLMASASVTSGMLSNAAQTIPGLKTFSGGLWDKGGQVFTVTAYGAVGDNSTDDAAAIQAANDACAAAGGGIVYFPQPSVAYKFNSTLNLGNGNATTVSTYDGVRWVGVGSGHSYLSGHRPAVKLRWGGGASIMIKINGPIAGAGLEELFLDGNSTATGGIQAVHSAFTVLRRIIVTGIAAGAVAPNNNVAVDIDSYNTSTFNAGAFVGVQGFNGLVEDLSVNTVGVNNITLLRIGNSGPVAQWQFKGGGLRGDGGTGGTAITLGYCDHNYFWGVTAKAATGLRIRPIAGVANFPVNDFFNGCSINATAAANSYVIDNSLAVWAPTAPYGIPFWGLPTIDGGAGTTPTDNKFWGVTDQQELFGGGWSVIGSAGLSMKPYGAAAGNTNELRFLELAANGTNYAGFKAPDSLAANIIYALPTTSPTAGQILSASAPSSGVSTLSWVPNTSGSSAQYILLTADFGLPNSRTLVGTANQITLTDGGAGANATLSFPSTIAQPTIVGGTAAGSDLTLRGTSNVAPVGADIILNGDYANAISGSVRIGTPTGGAYTCEIVGPASAQLRVINSDASSVGGGAGIQAGYSSLPTAADHRLAFYTFGASANLATNTANGAAITGYSSEAWVAGTNQGAYIKIETTPTASGSRREIARFSNMGLFNPFKGADVASAAAIVPTGNVFHVTGTTNITSITSTGIQAGTFITIIFDGILTFTDGSNLKLAGNYVTSADDTISLVYDGTNWYELCRSGNI